MNVSAELGLLGEILLAAVLGGAIGAEREAADKPAGFRTHLLVTAGAALLLGLSEALIGYFGRITHSSVVQSDPVRIVEAIITGVSFLGAGTIFRHTDSDHVEGLTTAASLLICAAIGMCVVLHYFVLSVGVTVLVIAVLMLSRFEKE